MKKIILIFILGLCMLKSVGCEKDSIFDIRLQHDSLADDFNVIFKNITNDTVLLRNNFKDYFEDLRYSPGFRVSFYFNGRLGIPPRGELPKQDYKIDNGRKASNYSISIAPQEEVTLTIQLPFGLLIKSIREKKRETSDNLCIILELYYICSIPKEKKAKMEYFKSDCLEIKL